MECINSTGYTSGIAELVLIILILVQKELWKCWGSLSSMTEHRLQILHQITHSPEVPCPAKLSFLTGHPSSRSLSLSQEKSPLRDIECLSISCRETVSWSHLRCKYQHYGACSIPMAKVSLTGQAACIENLQSEQVRWFSPKLGLPEEFHKSDSWWGWDVSNRGKS